MVLDRCGEDAPRGELGQPRGCWPGGEDGGQHGVQLGTVAGTRGSGGEPLVLTELHESETLQQRAPVMGQIGGDDAVGVGTREKVRRSRQRGGVAQIGRESCRERVCQYVWIWVVAE